MFVQIKDMNGEFFYVTRVESSVNIQMTISGRWNELSIFIMQPICLLSAIQTKWLTVTRLKQNEVENWKHLCHLCPVRHVKSMEPIPFEQIGGFWSSFFPPLFWSFWHLDQFYAWRRTLSMKVKARYLFLNICIFWWFFDTTIQFWLRRYF